MRKSVAVVAVLAVFIAAAGLFLSSQTGMFAGSGLLREQALVARVIDGDTIELENGERVRFLGMDTPERGQILFLDAKERVRELIEGKTVALEGDRTNRDKYDRLLRHVWLGNENIGVLMVREGYASVYIIEPDHKYEGELRAAQDRAQENNLGIWRYQDIEDAFCIAIHQFRYNAAGNDNENLNGEYVTFRNKCVYPVDVSGWSLSDEANAIYTFPRLVIGNKTTVALHTGSGQDTETDIYWRMSRAVWNNNGDRLRMWNSDGELVLDYEYL